MDTLGGRIKFIQKAKGLTINDFAEVLNISRDTLINYQQNRTYPDSRILSTICEKYGINPTWLLMGRGEPFPGENQKTEAESKPGVVIPIDGPMDRAMELLLQAERETGITADPELRRRLLQKARMLLTIGELKDDLLLTGIRGNNETNR